MPRPKPRSALKVWRTARRRPLARCATERLRWPPIRKDTPQPRLTRQDPSLHPSLVSLPCKPRLSLRSGYLCWCPPTHSSAALARLPGQQCANTRFAMSQPQGWVMALTAHSGMTVAPLRLRRMPSPAISLAQWTEGWLPLAPALVRPVTPQFAGHGDYAGMGLSGTDSRTEGNGETLASALCVR